MNVAVHRVTSPVDDNKKLESAAVGDILYISGLVVTARDMVYKRVVLENVKPPIDLRGYAVWHAGPIAKSVGGKWHIVSIGSTSSIRLEPLEPMFIERTGVKIVIGKGVVGKTVAEACRKYSCIVTVFPGGLGALGAEAVKRVVDVYWLELGIPEAMWVLEVENLGPLIVVADVKGNTFRGY